MERLLLLNGKKSLVNFGPPIDHRLDRMNLMKLLDRVGFSTIESIDIGGEFLWYNSSKIIYKPQT